VHQENARHFAYTTITAARGLCDFAALARRAGNEPDQKKFRALAAQVERDFVPAFTAPEGYLLGARERSPAYDTDASVLEAFNFGILPPGAPAWLPTRKRLESLRTPAGGFGRLVGTASYDVDEWSYVDFRMASANFRLGKRAEGIALLERLAERAAANGGLFPEMYNTSKAKGALGAYRGSIPMVGYGSGAYMLALLDREGLFERDACE
jgi:GH15 family glucan-1,4-alpha-glucosidase